MIGMNRVQEISLQLSRNYEVIMKAFFGTYGGMIIDQSGTIVGKSLIETLTWVFVTSCNAGLG